MAVQQTAWQGSGLTNNVSLLEGSELQFKLDGEPGLKEKVFDFS